ncbi:MAG: GMC family oxidoreductase [Acetobacteraceae bacterium]
MRGYDYIIVGGGSAGCLAAARLVNEFGARVLLLEAGGDYKGWLLQAPAGFSRILSGTKYLTQHATVPQGELGGRVAVIPQAKVLGGGSSVNAQAYMRGRAADYDGWGTIARTDLWSWKCILPHFVRVERNQKFNNHFHGVTGTLRVSDQGFVCDLSHIYVQTVQGMGIPFTPDFNQGAPAGVGYPQVTAGGGRRCGAVDAFLSPVLGNPNLVVETGARVHRLLIENARAVGVAYRRRGAIEMARTEGEVLLAAGAFISPKLLMLSGLGPAAELRKFGIAVIADLPGVGANLQDHCGAPLIARGSGGLGYFRQDRGWRMLANGLEYALFRRGRITTNGVEACSFHVPDDVSGDPVVQIYCVPSTGYVDPTIRGSGSIDGLTLHPVLMRPRSIGWVRLASADPEALPLVNPNYLAEAWDRAQLREGLRVARSILRSAPLSAVVQGELAPGQAAESDAALDDYLHRAVRTDYHPVGTCRMGHDGDPFAVVGPNLRVFGIDGLRVIDASVMPRIVTANTNAPTMAVADHAVSLMRSSTSLSPGTAAPPGERLETATTR